MSSASCPRSANLMDLSDDVIILVLQNLSGVDLARMSQVSTRFQKLTSHPSLWRKACYRLPNFPSTKVKHASQSRTDFWQICFRQFYCRPNSGICLGCMKTVSTDCYDPTVVPMCTFVRNRTSESTNTSNAV
ncbi:hypothetical protein BWQ96_08457 [Gracilariopsis chorda]|uniref:F-box domain-containing protein n=1 Tax=Gracilariopsis chorda TaxID=448386 RepID=A0A2V3IIC3_9FLOR|nr:hypothetical protein BWQ96_08457 [Gracilariopsis chorda]|eukprot:PXF41809.1 hypothetical protein BWQ96_08457 [Gracilariopsis chorda]